MVIHLIVIFEAHWFKQLALIKNTTTGSTASYADRYKVEESYFNQKLRKNLLLSVNWMLEQIGQRLWRSYFPGDFQNLTGKDPQQLSQTDSALSRRVARWYPGVFPISAVLCLLCKKQKVVPGLQDNLPLFLTSGDKPAVTLPLPVLVVKGELDGQSWVRLGCGCRSEGTISSCIYETTVRGF